KSLFINVARLQAGPPRQTGHLHHAENVPEGKAIAVDMAAGSVSVKRQPLRAVDKCTHTPGPGDQLRPCDILERIAHMRHFPVENRAQPLGAVDKIPDTKIAVNDDYARKVRGNIAVKTAQSRIDNRCHRVGYGRAGALPAI